MTLIKAQAGVKNNMRRLNQSIIREGSSHVMHVVLFALLLFFIFYFLAKFSRRWGQLRLFLHSHNCAVLTQVNSRKPDLCKYLYLILLICWFFESFFKCKCIFTPNFHIKSGIVLNILAFKISFILSEN